MLCFNEWRIKSQARAVEKEEDSESLVGEREQKAGRGSCSHYRQLALLCPLPAMVSVQRREAVFLGHPANSSPKELPRAHPCILGPLNPGVPASTGCLQVWLAEGAMKLTSYRQLFHRL